MEGRNDIMSLLNQGCTLVRSLESSLENSIDNYPQNVAYKCDEIIEIFTKARHQLSNLQRGPVGNSVDPEVMAAAISQGMMAAAFDYTTQRRQHEEEDSGKGKEVVIREVIGEGSIMSIMGVRETGGTSCRNPRSRSSRKDDEGRESRRTVRMPAPKSGNTDIPPDDGFTWRKYGQKEILGTRFPRSYYRCTHQRLFNCQAKKHVQRLDDDPYIFEILYRGDHTCHMSLTAPLLVPPHPSPAVQNIIFPHHSISAAASPPNQWLFMDLPMVSSEGASSGLDLPTPAVFRVDSSSSVLGNNDAPAGPSTVGSYHQGRDAVDFANHPVMDLVDAMFNSGSSSGNSMEIIFSQSGEKWEGPTDKEN